LGELVCTGAGPPGVLVCTGVGAADAGAGPVWLAAERGGSVGVWILMSLLCAIAGPVASSTAEPSVSASIQTEPAKGVTRCATAIGLIAAALKSRRGLTTV